MSGAAVDAADVWRTYDGRVHAVAGASFAMSPGESLPRMLALLDVVEPHVTAWVLGRGLLVGIAIGFLGGSYPAWRATRMPPAGVLARG